MLEVSVEDVMVVVDDIVPDSEDVARAMHNSDMVPDSVVSPDSEMVAAEDLNMVILPPTPKPASKLVVVLADVTVAVFYMKNTISHQLHEE
ncbi:hypothetical protein HU200_029659 [Digitaria exilis]|uniref:Uncharacterized protein n=1 Tax=Digitaria exilis TaxID=1010633 RepID=A0A835EUP8_9POAL|nr:hypothetical protein HU200_029659 [Digitaria exilis]